MTEARRHDYANKATCSPFLDRAALRAKDKIVSQMADDLRVFATNRGSVTEADLELAGWTPTQIVLHGAEAARHARKLSANRT